MTTKLTSKQASFVKMMKEGDEYERRGFELLLKRGDFEAFFDALESEGLFDPSRNPGPTEADKPGYYWVPPWRPLPYLEAVSKRADDLRDLALAHKVTAVIRRVTEAHNADGKATDNYHTWSAFARMLGTLPREAVTTELINLMEVWLGGRFDNTLVGHSLISTTLKRFLASNDPGDWQKASRALYHTTSIRLVDVDLNDETSRKEVRTVVDDYWLKELVKAYAADLGKKCRQDAADIFKARLKTVFAQNADGRQTWLLRPAIEDHAQNYDWRNPENSFVNGLRDALTSWLDSDPLSAGPYIVEMLDEGAEIVERVALYFLDKRFSVLKASIAKAIRLPFFDMGHHHELYHLLKNHFAEFPPTVQSATLATIRQFALPDREADSERIQKRNQLLWIEAIARQGSTEVDAWYKELKEDQSLGSLGPHPDFIGYHESRFGPGPAAYSTAELIAMLEGGIIIEKLNAFVPGDFWDGPTKRALTDAVAEAVESAPLAFLENLPAFLGAKPEYRYAVIAGFKKLWDTWDGTAPSLDWDALWQGLVGFFEPVLGGADLWEGETPEDKALTPTRDWIPPLISEFLIAGTRDDKKAYVADLLPRTLELIKILLAKSPADREAKEHDALTQAINSPRGKAIEALVNHSLRACRLEDKASQGHMRAWANVLPLFDAELATCRNANFEFSALAGSYIANLNYLSADWLETSFKAIFPVDYPANCLCALDGLAYAPPTEPIYRHLVESDVLAWALHREDIGEHARENLTQRMCLAYLWRKDELNSPQFSYLFDNDRVDAIRIASHWFWSISNQELTEDQKGAILLFWDRCVTWSKTTKANPANILSSLSLLACYLPKVGPRELAWLLAVAPHVSRDYNADQLIEELERLADISPVEVAQVLFAVLTNHHPSYDGGDTLKKLLIKLAANAETRSTSILCLDRVRDLPGMIQLYAQLGIKNT